MQAHTSHVTPRLPRFDHGNSISQTPEYSQYIQSRFGCSLEDILAPIGDNQVGESVRHNGVYFAIKEARREDDPNLPQGVWTHDMKLADWDKVEKTAIDALCHRSKDLQLGVWLMESSIHRYGFAGIAPAATLIRALCESFWGNMHPQMVDGDIEFRTNPINWINEKLSLSLRLIPITSTPLDGRECHWDDWDNAQRFEQMKLQHQGDLHWEGITSDAFKQRLAATPKAFFLEEYQQISDGIEAIDLLISWFDQQCGSDSPSLGEMRALLMNVSDMITNELTRRGVSVSDNNADNANTHHQDDADHPSNPSGNGGDGGNGDSGDSGNNRDNTRELAHRSDAFAQLREAAEFLMRDDPHSPVPYMVYTACQWGEKGAPELYDELFLQKGGQLNIFEMMGLSNQESTNE